jgi:hypothetical protein
MTTETLPASGLAAYIPGLLPLSFLILAAGITYLAWRPLVHSSVDRWREPGAAVLSVAFFGLLDWLLLASLPTLGLSYGPVDSSWVLSTGARLPVLLVATAPTWLHLKISQRRGRPRATSQSGPLRLSAPLFSLWALNLGLLAGAVYSMAIEPFDLRTTHLVLPAPAPGFSRPLRLLHISDIHVERTTRREIDLLERVHQLQPDLILLTGDYINADYIEDPQARQDAASLLAQLSAPYGVYAVTGNVDTPDFVQEVFHDLPIHMLQDEVISINVQGIPLYLVGISNRRADLDPLTWRSLMAQVPQGAYTILLYHRSDLIEDAARRGVNLYLSGHTHGGQVRLPWWGAIITFSKYGKKYESGLYQVGPTTLYVSRGVGLEGLRLPRLRFLCPPEVTLIEMGP